MITNREQRGYLTVLVALFLIVLGLALFAFYDSGRLILAKTRLQQTADATAYSAAVIQARELNFHAHMNRAMVSNQVAIGQMVSLSSYLQVNQQIWWGIRLIGSYLQFIPAVGTAIRASTTVAEQAMGLINQAGQYAGSNISKLADSTNGILSNASTLWHKGTLITLANDLIAISQANDSSVQTGFASATVFLNDLRKFQQFLRRNDLTKVLKTPVPKRKRARRHPRITEQRFDEFRGVVISSLDGFSKGRNQTFWSFRLPGLPYSFEFSQRGGSYLGAISGQNKPYFSWSAVDTLSLWVEKRKYGWFGGKTRSENPLAWGRQATHHKKPFRWKDIEQETTWNGASNENSSAYRTVQLRDSYGQNFLEGARGTPSHIGHFKVSDSGLNQGFGKLTPYSAGGGNLKGLRDFFDLNKDNRVKGRSLDSVNASTAFNIILKKPLNTVHSSIPKQGGVFDLHEGSSSSPPKALHAIAAGRAVFEAPRLGNSSRTMELGNLYNPFWVPKLVPTDKRNPALLAAMAGR